MITEQALKEAILECEGERNPNASTCIKLAAYYVIRNEMFGEKPQYSYASAPVESPELIPYFGDSDFAQAVQGRDMYEVLEILDDLMNTLQVVNPKLYESVLRRF